MKIEEIMLKMIRLSEKNLHDISHFMKVHSFARTIAQIEIEDEHTRYILEAAAIIHDISCPLCRRKYGNANGKHQEEESEPLVRAFFEGTDMNPEDIERIVYLITHHHTYTNVDGIDYQILLEADYLVNAGEGGHSIDSIQTFRHRVFKTETGKQLLDMIYLN